MFSVYLFAADPEQLCDKFANDQLLLPGIRARIVRERGVGLLGPPYDE